MKKEILILFSLLTVLTVSAQGPTLNLVGSSPKLAKGTIDTEVLASVIQQKQEEVKQKVFRNLIVKEFNKSTYTQKFRNFTSYKYIYDLMNTMTSGKNKTAINKMLIESSVEFAYVYGTVLYLQYDTNNRILPLAPANISTLTQGATPILNAVTNEVQLNIANVREFNIVIDMCYDIIIRDANLQRFFKFKNNITDSEFLRWYERDNAYMLVIADPAQTVHYTNLRAQLANRISQLVADINAITPLIQSIKNLSSSTDVNLAAEATTLVNNMYNLNQVEIQTAITNMLVRHTASIGAERGTLTNAANFFVNNYDDFKMLQQFFEGLRKSDFKDFTMTREQYYGLKYIMLEFLNLVENQYPNNATASVIEFLLENTLVEYSDISGNPKPENEARNSDKGYLYIDIESVISAIYQRYSSSNRGGIGVYIQPFFSIGTNYASFGSNNTLGADATSLDNVYFASEKIGIKWKLYNWKYIRSFEPGKSYSYYNTNRYWFRPQEKPTISDIYISAYGSGLLYNIANLKSETDFDYGMVGASFGITFFNGLTAGIGIACPFTDNKFHKENNFFTAGIDIPIIDYIAALAKKNK